MRATEIERERESVARGHVSTGTGLVRRGEEAQGHWPLPHCTNRAQIMLGLWHFGVLICVLVSAAHILPMFLVKHVQAHV